MRINYLSATLLALVMAGCGHEDTYVSEIPDRPVDTFPDDGSIRVTTHVNSTVLSRTATGTTDFSGSEFQLIINPEAKQVNGKDLHEDYHYQLKVEKNPVSDDWDLFSGTYGTTSPTTPLGDKIPLWAGPAVKTDVKAYTNYVDKFDVTTAGSPGSPLLDQHTIDKCNTIDLLYFYKSVSPGTELDSDKKLAIDFTHRLSQLNILLKFGTEFNRVGGAKTMDPALIKSVGIYEMKNAYSFDITSVPTTGSDANYPKPQPTGSAATLTDLENDPASTLHITPYVSDELKQGNIPTIAYTALIVPQKVAKSTHLIVITLYPMNNDGTANTTGAIRNFIYSPSEEIDFESGKSYKLTLSLGKDQITGGTLIPQAWESGSSDTIITD